MSHVACALFTDHSWLSTSLVDVEGRDQSGLCSAGEHSWLVCALCQEPVKLWISGWVGGAGTVGTVMLQPVPKVTCNGREQRGTPGCLCLCGHVHLSLTCTDSWFSVGSLQQGCLLTAGWHPPAGCHITSVRAFAAAFSY